MDSLVYSKYELDKNTAYPRASIKENHICPGCKKLHTKEDPAMVVVYRTQTAYVFRCFKAREDGSQSKHCIPISKE